MKNRNCERLWMVAVIGLGVGLTVGIAGCSDEPEVAVAPAPPAPPPPPPAPTVTPIEQLMEEMNIDSRVSLPEAKAPATDVQRRAVLEFFDALARGNAAALRGMLVVTDQYELDALLESGAWDKTVSNIQRIDVQTGSSPQGDACALAVVEVMSGYASSFQPQLWYYTAENEQPQFEAVATPPGIMDRLSGPDWIALWHRVLEEELAKADEVEVKIEVVQRDVQDPMAASGGGGGMRAPGSAPPAPGSGGGGGDSPGRGAP